MLNQNQIKLIQEITDKYSKEYSVIKASEELAELQVSLTQSVTKIEQFSGVEHYGRVLDEVADVTIQLEAIKHLFTITPQMFELTLQKKIEKMKSKFENQ
jgi:hypothetical protein